MYQLHTCLVDSEMFTVRVLFSLFLHSSSFIIVDELAHATKSMQSASIEGPGMYMQPRVNIPSFSDHIPWNWPGC